MRLATNSLGIIYPDLSVVIVSLFQHTQRHTEADGDSGVCLYWNLNAKSP